MQADQLLNCLNPLPLFLYLYWGPILAWCLCVLCSAWKLFVMVGAHAPGCKHNRPTTLLFSQFHSNFFDDPVGVYALPPKFHHGRALFTRVRRTLGMPSGRRLRSSGA